MVVWLVKVDEVLTDDQLRQWKEADHGIFEETWGTNEHTLVTAKRFKEMLETLGIEPPAAVYHFIRRKIYIDLES